MATPKHKASATWLWGPFKAFGLFIWLVLFVMALLLVAVLGGRGFLHDADQASTSTTSTSVPAIQNPNLVQIPGLSNVSYTLGLADRFAALEKTPAQACVQWNKLSGPLKQGLAFVDAKAVPKCAAKSYLVTARAEHHQRSASQYSNRTGYYDLGNPPVPDDYTGYHYSCTYLTGLTKYTYAPPKTVKLSENEFENLYNLYNFDRSHMTPVQLKKWDVYTKAQSAKNKYEVTVYSDIRDLYSDGGNFDKDCYPPGVVFGADESVTFYPNHPVKSLLDTPAPVFFSPGGSNTVGRGKPYVIQPGDNPSSVAAKFYDVGCDPGFDCYGWSEWPLIIAANNLSMPIPGPYDTFTLDLSKLKWVVGQTIYIPNPDT